MRKPVVRWDDRARAWRSDVGPHGSNGRRRAVYFREIPETPKGERQAAQALAEYLAERDRRETASAESVTNPRVWQVVELYLAHSEATVDEVTFRSHGERLNRWMKEAPGATADASGRVWTDARLARDLEDTDLSRVAKALTRAGHSPHYVMGIVRSVKACWAWAATRDSDRVPALVVAENPFSGVKGPTIPDSPERYYPPRLAEELLAFIDAEAAKHGGATGRHARLTALLFRCLYETGARPSELCRATWSDLDEAASCLVFRKHKTSGKGAGKPRRVPLTADMLARLLRAREKPGRHLTAIFTHLARTGTGRRTKTDALAGEPWDVGHLGQRFRHLRKRAAALGLDIHVRDGTDRVPSDRPECTLYDFRRSFSTDAASSGFSDDEAADAQGNSAEMQRRIYRTRHASAAVKLAESVAEGRKKKASPPDVGGTPPV